MIALYMNRRDYENDIRSLLMAFFYGDKIVLNAKEWDVCLDVRYALRLRWRDICRKKYCSMR